VIREATYDDFPAICQMLREHHPLSEYACFGFDEGKLKADLRVATRAHGRRERSTMCCFVAVEGDTVVGVCIGMVCDVLVSRDWLATISCLLVDEKRRTQAHGLWLITRFMKWAKAIPRVKKVAIGYTSGLGEPERVEGLFRTMGFEHYGSLWKRDLEV